MMSVNFYKIIKLSSKVKTHKKKEMGNTPSGMACKAYHPNRNASTAYHPISFFT